MRRTRAVSQCLTVAADGADTFFIKPRLPDDGVGGVGEQPAQQHVELSQTFDFIGASLHEGLDVDPCRGRDGMSVARHERRGAIGGDRNQGGVNAIHAGSRHQPDVVHGLNVG